MFKLSVRARESLISLCLVAIFLLLATQFMGISTGDDSFYLWTGDFIKLSALFGPQGWSPLYCLWFKLLSVAAPDPIARYFLSWAILAALTALFPTVMKITGAWFYCFLIVGIPLLTVGPFVSLFAAAIVLLGMCLVLRCSWRTSRVLALGCAVSFTVSFARPEFSFCVFLFAGAALVALAIDRWGDRSSVPAPGPRKRGLVSAAVAIMVVSCSVCTFFVFTRSHSARSGVAFAQHYNARAAESGLFPGGAGAWRSDYAERRFGIDAGHNALNGTATVGDFLRANPRLFFGHLFRNLVDPKTWVFLLFVLAVVSWPWIRADAKHLRLAGVWLGLLALPPSLGMIVIYPRAHYALIALPSLLLFAVQLFKPQHWRTPSVPWVLALGVSLIWLRNIGVPRLQHAPMTEDRIDLLRTECIRAVDRSADPANPNIFDDSPVNAIYFVHPRTVIRPESMPQWPQLSGWIDRTHPAWLAIGPHLADAYNLTPLQLDTFLQQTEGYTATVCPSAAQLTLYSKEKR